ncbi:MAG: hypothetical protein ACRD5W_04510, partial [Candidatus Acidiferrales bacterium]
LIVIRIAMQHPDASTLFAGAAILSHFLPPLFVPRHCRLSHRRFQPRRFTIEQAGCRAPQKAKALCVEENDEGG